MTSEPRYQARLKTPFAVLGIATANGQLTGIDFLPRDTATLAPRDDFTRAVCDQLHAYLADAHFHFDLPLALHGTPHQMKVWKTMLRIPRGQALTYGEIATRLDSSPRAVGRACGDNPIPIVVPCHRVVAKNGRGGFMHHASGDPLAIKDWLLAHEGYIENSRSEPASLSPAGGREQGERATLARSEPASLSPAGGREQGES